LRTKDEDFAIHFDTSTRAAGWLSSTANLDFEPRVIDETDETILKLDGKSGLRLEWRSAFRANAPRLRPCTRKS